MKKILIHKWRNRMKFIFKFLLIISLNLNSRELFLMTINENEEMEIYEKVIKQFQEENNLPIEFFKIEKGICQSNQKTLIHICFENQKLRVLHSNNEELKKIKDVFNE